MYSYEDLMKAVRLYIKYNFSVADTVRELGYPSRSMLRRWYKGYREKGGLHKEYKRHPEYSQKQKQAVATTWNMMV